MERNLQCVRSSGSWNHQVTVAVTRVVLAVLMILSAWSENALADEDRFLATGTVRARALAMGSAYHSLEDDLAAGFYNPGAFRLNATKSERRFRLFINPVAPAAGFYDFSKYDVDFDRDGGLSVGEALYALSWLVKGFGFSTHFLDLGVGLGEEAIGCSRGDDSGRIFSVKGLTSCSFHSAFINLKIADSISMGIAGTLYNARIDETSTVRGGYSFGVLLAPNPKMDVGIVYNRIPREFENARMGLECIEDEAATAGISYHPDTSTVLSIDLRAVNKEDQPTSREIHAGLERRFFERIALRAGYYRRKSTNSDVFSFGIGVLPLWEKIAKYSNSSRNDIVSYSLILDEDSVKRRWHVVSLLLRF